LNSSAEGVVAEGCRPNTGIDDLRQPVLKVPSEAAALGVGEGIAVCVVGVATERTRCQLVRRIVLIRRHAERTQPIPHRVIGIALSGTTALRDLGQFVQRIVTIIRGYPVQVIGFAGAISGSVICIAGSVQNRASRLVQHAQQMRNRIVAVAGVHPIRAEGTANGLGAQPAEAAGGTAEPGLGLGFRGRSTQ